MLRIAINGYGRIGRSVLRALIGSPLSESMRVVAINEPADLATIAHLTRYDSTHGRFKGELAVEETGLRINGDFVAVSHETDLAALPWSELDIDLLLECSGTEIASDALAAHLQAGAKRVLLSQPGESDIPAIVYGLNEQILSADIRIASAASCTSNGITPAIKVLHREFDIVSGSITTIHSAMNDQPVLDAYHHTDLRKTRSAGLSIIPVDTGLAAGIGRVLPDMADRFTATALRVPTHNVSAMELTVHVNRTVSEASVNAALKLASESDLAGILGYTEEPLASCDFLQDPRSGIVDAGQTRVSGQLVNILVWFDNEWAFAHRMLDVAAHWCLNRAGEDAAPRTSL